MKTIRAAVSAALALCAAQAFAETHTVTFRRMNGTVLSKVEVEHGGSVTPPSGPVESDHTFKGWDHGEWLGCVTNDIQVYALYEGTKTWAKGTNYGSKNIAFRDEPYSLDEYFKMYDNLAWADEFSRSGTNDVNRDYWNYDTENRHGLNYETSGDNQKEHDGNLTINVRREKRTRTEFDWSTWSSQTVEYDFTGGGIKSNGKVAFKYGRCEIRAKLTRQKGCWPAFWMMGNYGNWPACGELDILEQPSGGDWICGTLHINPPAGSGSISNGSVVTPQDGVHFGDGFHRFGTIMNEREVIWYVDDHIFKRMDVRDSRYHMCHDRPWFIIFGMGIQSNVWVQVPDAPATKYDVPELDERGVDFLVDYCRIFTNTNEGNTVEYQPAAASAKLSAPVKATVWRGWDMCWGRTGAGSYQNNIQNLGWVKEVDYIKTVMTKHLAEDQTDVLTFLTEPSIMTLQRRGEFDIPGYTMLSISFNGNQWNNWDNAGSGNMGRTQLFGNALFNRDRFSASESGVDFMTLSSDTAFTNCYALCADLKEKATGARVKVVSVNVTATNGVENAGGTVAQGFDTLFSKLNAMKDDNVIVFFQGMNQKLYNYIKARAASSLQSPYSLVGKVDSVNVYQCSYATANRSATAARVAKIPIAKSNLLVSYSQNPQALQAEVVFDELPDDGFEESFVAADYAKSMDVTFSGYSGSTLTNFPVLVRLSTAISGFRYSDFLREDGGDLRFTDSSGTVLPHEIDTWNPNGESTVWVKVPSLRKDAKIVAHYGCARPVRVDSSQVWDSNYVGVWHLGESALPLVESSGVSADFTHSTGETIGYGAQGVVGGSVDFANGPSNAVVALDHDALDNFSKFTVEAWTKQAEHKANAGILSKRESSRSNCSYYFYDNNGKTSLCVGTNTSCSAQMASNIVKPAVGDWAYQAYSVDMKTSVSNVCGYLDGVARSPQSVAFAVNVVSNRIGNLTIGNLNANASDNSFNGLIDEVRISKIARSAAWIKATHDTVTQADFATYEVQGGEEPPEPPDPPEPQDEFAHAVAVSFTGYSGGAALTDFPVLVRLSPAIPGFSYSGFSLPDGGDLRFFDTAGNMLAHEIDTWDASGVSTVWVKVPTLDASTKITAKYGCSEPPESADPKSVWSNGYSGVWHMGGATRKQADSTSSGKNMEGHSTYSANMTFGADGAVGKAVEQATPPDGGGRYRGGFQASDSSGLYNDTKTLTVEMWASAREIVNDKYILRNKTGNTLYSGRWTWSTAGGCKLNYTVAMTNLAAGTGHEYKGLAYSVATNDLPGAWRHYALVVDNEALYRIEAYQDGASKKTQAISDAGESLAAGSGTMAFGNSANSNTNQAFAGTIDELRISRVARSADWIKATHDTVMNADFATYAMSGGGTAAGYAAWIAGKGVTGAAGASDKVTNGIANGVRYAFDIDPATSEIGTPIIQVVRDANGNPSVQSRDLATGRDDVTFGILATPDLTDWSNAKLVPMTKFATDGLWKPTASGSSGYVFPSQMFFKYTIDIQ